MSKSIFKFNLMQTVAVIDGDVLKPARIIERFKEYGFPSYRVKFINSDYSEIVWEEELIEIPETE